MRLSSKELVTWWLGSEGEGGKGVHDKVDPQHLNGVKGGFSQNGSSDEGHNEGDEVDGQLELQEFPDGVEDVSSPFHGSDN